MSRLLPSAQVFVYLLRACQPEVRKALVRESLDVLIPVLDKRMAAGAAAVYDSAALHGLPCNTCVNAAIMGHSGDATAFSPGLEV